MCTASWCATVRGQSRVKSGLPQGVEAGSEVKQQPLIELILLIKLLECKSVPLLLTKLFLVRELPKGEAVPLLLSELFLES